MQRPVQLLLELLMDGSTKRNDNSDVEYDFKMRSIGYSHNDDRIGMCQAGHKADCCDVCSAG
jgi:hypothetical protein